MPRGAGLPSAYLTCTSIIPPVPWPPLGLCARRQEAKRQKSKKERERRVEVRNMRHPQNSGRGSVQKTLLIPALEVPFDYKQRRKIRSKKRGRLAAPSWLRVKLPGQHDREPRTERVHEALADKASRADHSAVGYGLLEI